MKLAIMQPYLFPYIGYFQLVNEVDHFCFYDDVNFIKNGYINRNSILVGGKSNYFSLPLSEASPNKLINEIEIQKNPKWLQKFLRTLDFNYAKAPFYSETKGIIKATFDKGHTRIANLAAESVIQIAAYLESETTFSFSSETHDNQMYNGPARVIELCKHFKAKTYINPYGGRDLYDKNEFEKEGFELYFSKSNAVEYKQHKVEFVPNLSIIDVLMFNSKDEVKELLKQFTLE